MKTVCISGNITKDAVLRRTQSGEPVTGFSVAVNDARTKSALFFDCSLWGKRGDALTAYLKKGTKVSVCGDLGTREHDGKTYLTVNVSEVTLMGGGEARSPQQRERPSSDDFEENGRPGQQANFSGDLDDDIPFLMEWR